MNESIMPQFEGRRVLVVEDEYVIAMEIAGVLEDCGAEIVGPAGSVEQALELISREPLIDAAVLDVNLAGRTVFPVARTLQDRLTPCLFSTGYDASVLGDFSTAPRIEKPADPFAIATTLRSLIAAREKADADLA